MGLALHERQKLAQLVKKYREQHSLSQAKFADACNLPGIKVSQSRISEVEREVDVAEHIHETISKALGYDSLKSLILDSATEIKMSGVVIGLALTNSQADRLRSLLIPYVYDAG